MANPQSTGVLTATSGAVAVANVVITRTTDGEELCTLRLVGTLAGSGTVSMFLPSGNEIYCPNGITYNITTGGGCVIFFSR